MSATLHIVGIMETQQKTTAAPHIGNVFTFRRPTAVDVLRVFSGALLLVAAALKTGETFLGRVSFTDAGFVPMLLLVELELALGFCLLFGSWPQLVWRVSLAVFLAFGIFSSIRAISGESSCGCFGPVEVHPFASALVDLSIVAAISKLKPALVCSESTSDFRYVRQSGAVTCILITSALATFAVVRSASAIDLSDHFTEDLPRLVKIDPEKWHGQECPIFRHLSGKGASALSHEKWIVVLYRNGCEECDEVLSSLARLAPSMKSQGFGVAAICVDGNVDSSGGDNILWDGLSPNATWLVDTPTILFVRNGVVGELISPAELERLM